MPFFRSFILVLQRLVGFFIPPREWQFPALLVCGTFVGLGLYIFHVSKASSYLSHDPKTCINCHVMYPHYAAWQRSSHARTAVCVDCHVPHDNPIRSYAFKIKDGTRHATIFTMRTEPQVIRIKEDGAAVVQENCIRCHTSVLEDVGIHKSTYEGYTKGENKLCWDCHREVPHGRVSSLSSAPMTTIPDDVTATPQWFDRFIPILEKYQQHPTQEDKP